MSGLVPLDDDIWTCTRDLELGGCNFGTRMTVIRLPDQALLIYSPVKLEPALQAELTTLGQVKYLIAPNEFHHLYLNSMLAGFPDAQVFCVPGLLSKRKDLQKKAHLLQAQVRYPWSDCLPATLVRGRRIYSEYVLHHPASQTLVLTDLFFNFEKTYRPYTGREKLLFRCIGAYHTTGPDWVMKLLLKKTPYTKARIQNMQSWDFEKIVMAHGALITKEGKALFEQAFRGYLA